LLSDGTKGNSKDTRNTWTKFSIEKPLTQIRKIKIGYGPNNQVLAGLKFYDRHGQLIFKTGFDRVNYHKSYSEYLAEGERVLGYRSRTHPDLTDWAYHCDFQLIIGVDPRVTLLKLLH
jgi:hypothetical protein